MVQPTPVYSRKKKPNDVVVTTVAAFFVVVAAAFVIRSAVSSRIKAPSPANALVAVLSLV